MALSLAYRGPSWTCFLLDSPIRQARKQSSGLVFPSVAKPVTLNLHTYTSPWISRRPFCQVSSSLPTISRLKKT